MINPAVLELTEIIHDLRVELTNVVQQRDALAARVQQLEPPSDSEGTVRPSL